MANIKWSAFTDGGVMQVGDQVVGLRAGDNRRFNFPGTGLQDSSGNYLIGWSSVGALAVNYIQTSNAVAGGSPFLIPAGTDANIALLLKSKGNGNITLTPSGTGTIVTSSALILNTSAPTTALQAASKGYVDSLLPSYPTSLANGGTNASLVASNGGIFYSTATAGAILSGTATANQILMSGASSAPSWSTATYPVTTTANQLLYSSANNTISGLATSANGILVTSNTSVPSILAAAGITGSHLTSNATSAPSWSTAMYADTFAINTILYASSANSVTGLTTANNGVLITGGTGIPSISSTLPSAVQGNITSLGTITSGVWNGSIISGTFGGTGINNGSSTITVGGNFAMSGAFAFTGTLTGATAVTFPTSGTLATTANIPSLPLSLANGGTAASLTASNGGIVYSGAAAFGVLSGTATANQVLLSGSNTTPAWSTAVYPATTTINQILYSSSANNITGLATANSAVLVTSSTGVPAFSSTMTNGQIIIGSTGGTPTAATITAGTNITITNAAGGITIDAATGGTAATQAEQEAGTSTTVYVSPGRQQYHQSASKAWLYSKYSAGVPQLTASYNITSITDNGTGDATVNIATDMSSADYCVVTGNNLANTSSVGLSIGVYSLAVGSFRLSLATSTGVPADYYAFNTVCFGDQ